MCELTTLRLTPSADAYALCLACEEFANFFLISILKVHKLMSDYTIKNREREKSFSSLTYFQ